MTKDRALRATRYDRCFVRENTINKNVLCLVMQEGCYPVSGLPVDAILFEFTVQAFMRRKDFRE